MSSNSTSLVQEAILQELETILENLEAKYKTYDPAQFVDIIHQNAIYTFTDGRFEGIDQILNAFKSTWETIENEIYTIKDVKWLVAKPDFAVCVYTFEWTGEIDGEIASGRGNATNVLVKDENQNWKFIHEHLSKINT